MLAVLNALDGGAQTNQRSVASRAGVALGLANALIKRCVRKGLVKISQAPARRYAYYLTPEGFAEKSRLVAEYLSVSLDFFRHARGAYADLFDLCEQRGWRRVALAGDGELAEIAHLAGFGRAIELVVITDAKQPQARFNALAGRLGTDRVLAPGFLQISLPARATDNLAS
jgi:DNA-binding MarR family transcriptional regulator